MANPGNKKKDTNLKPQQLAKKINNNETLKRALSSPPVDTRGTKSGAPRPRKSTVRVLADKPMVRTPKSKTATPKPTKNGLKVAVPGGKTLDTATGKITSNPKDIPIKKTKGMTPEDAAMKKILQKKYGYK